MRVAHVIPSFYPARIYGGPIESSYQLCRQLARAGHDVRVITTDAAGRTSTLEIDPSVEVRLAERLLVRYARRVLGDSISPALLRLLPAYVSWADLVHLTAIYSFPTIPTLFLCRVLGRPIVWSPRGALQRWNGTRRLVLKWIWEQACRLVVPRLTVLHATSDEEAHEIGCRVGRVPIAVIANGVCLPKAASHVLSTGRLRLVYLGRLDPKKGLESLLQACSSLRAAARVRWSLTIAGQGDDRYTEALRQQIQRLQLNELVTMIGHVDEERKASFFANADIAVIPSHTENFGMVVAEALAHGVPVIASRGTPWRRVEEYECGLWVYNQPDRLAQAIERMALSPLREMGARGREWMRREFSWEERAREMANLYTTLLRASR